MQILTELVFWWLFVDFVGAVWAFSAVPALQMAVYKPTWGEAIAAKAVHCSEALCIIPACTFDCSAYSSSTFPMVDPELMFPTIEHD